jgi:MFS family permease
MAFLVREVPHSPGASRPFLGALAALPPAYRRYLLAVGLFGLGDFSHTLLILRAMEILTPSLGARGAAASAMGLYGLHNAAGALLALPFGAAGDRLGRRRTLALAYLLGPVMILLLILPASGGGARGGLVLTAVFLVGGALLAAEDALESAAAAEDLPPDLRGTGFGALAAINSAGDLVSSLVLGILWKAIGPSAAFALALVPMLAGAAFLGSRPRGR